MSSNARFKRGSYCDTNLHSEMKTWRRNRMEDRKLSLQNEMVDKHMASRRKSYQHDKVSLNKEFDDKFSKKTLTADEYLEKSQPKYATWKERERERLDRKYRSLHMSYMDDFRKLGIKNYGPPKQRRKSKSEDSNESSEVADADKDSTSLDNESTSEEDALLALEKLNLDISRRRFSDMNLGNKHANSRRRGSTGSIDLAEFTKLRSLHLALTTVTEHTQDQEESEDETESGDKIQDLNDITTKGKTFTTKDETVEDITVEDLLVRPKRRASIATIPKPPPRDNPLVLGKRLDRRPTLPNIAIPFNYGN